MRWKWWPSPVAPEATKQVRIVARLSPEMLADLRRRCGGGATCIVGQQTTDIQAGYMLGMNYVLNKIAEDFTISAS